MLNYRRIGVTFVLGLAGACSKSAASPTQSSATTATITAPAPAPKPGDSNNPDYLAIRFVCVAGPVPAAPGRSAVVSRELSYEDFGLALPARPVTTTIRHVSGPVEPGSVVLEKAQRERLYGAAIAALNQPAMEPEHAVPDGDSCKLEVFRSVMQLDTTVQLPTANAHLRSLVGELVPLLPTAK